MIGQAIQAEKDYIKNKLLNLPFRPLITIMQEYGYENLDAYFQAKRDYLIKSLNFNIVYYKGDNIFETVRELLAKEEPVILFVEHQEPFIYHGNKAYNLEAAQEALLDVHEGGYAGGTIIGDKGDLSIGIFYPNEIDVNSNYFLDIISEALSTFNIQSTVDNNDLMIDGKKVLGSAMLSTENYNAFVSYLSFSDKAELIKEICGESTKVPGFISSISIKELEQGVIKCLH